MTPVTPGRSGGIIPSPRRSSGPLSGPTVPAQRAGSAGAGRLLRGEHSGLRRWDATDTGAGEPDVATPTVFCLPPAGAHSLTFRPLAGELPGCHVVALDPPGHGCSRVEPFERVEDVATEAVRWVEAEVTGPVLLLGHSYGGYVAYEAVRQLQARRHDAPVGLAVVCSAAPGVRVLKELPNDDAEAIALFSGHGGVPEVLLEHPDLLAPAIALLRADLASATRFSKQLDLRTPLEVPSMLVAGRDDDLVKPAMMEPWERLLPTADSYVLPGGHFPPRDQSGALARLLRPLLAGLAVH